MATRHERRRNAKAKALATLQSMAMAERSRQIAAIVSGNKRQPKGIARYVWAGERLSGGVWYTVVRRVYERNAYRGVTDSTQQLLCR